MALMPHELVQQECRSSTLMLMECMMVIALVAVLQRCPQALMDATKLAQHRMAHHPPVIGHIHLANLIQPEVWKPQAPHGQGFLDHRWVRRTPQEFLLWHRHVLVQLPRSPRGPILAILGVTQRTRVSPHLAEVVLILHSQHQGSVLQFRLASPLRGALQWLQRHLLATILELGPMPGQRTFSQTQPGSKIPGLLLLTSLLSIRLRLPQESR